MRTRGLIESSLEVQVHDVDALVTEVQAIEDHLPIDSIGQEPAKGGGGAVNIPVCLDLIFGPMHFHHAGSTMTSQTIEPIGDEAGGEFISICARDESPCECRRSLRAPIVRLQFSGDDIRKVNADV